jgi:hypothetical protein
MGFTSLSTVHLFMLMGRDGEETELCTVDVLKTDRGAVGSALRASATMLSL